VVFNLGHTQLSGIGEDILAGTSKYLTSIKIGKRNSLNLEPVLILALKKILPRRFFPESRC
jgi:hypothetical protein